VSVSSAVAVFSSVGDSGAGRSGFSVSRLRFGSASGSVFESFEAGGPAEVESPAGGDVSSAWAMPPANPTTTQAHSTHTTTVSRNFVDISTPLPRIGWTVTN
jgi:hypothetical protein